MQKFTELNKSDADTLVNLSSIQFGEFTIEVSYLSNFPIEFSRCVSKLQKLFHSSNSFCKPLIYYFFVLQSSSIILL